MKTWHVVCTYDSFLADIVRANTAGQAKIRSWMFTDEGIEFIELRARREPKLDGVGELTPRLIHEAGYMVPCRACGEFTMDNWNDEKICIVGENIYHESCMLAQVRLNQKRYTEAL